MIRKYRRRTIDVHAMQNDGTDKTAEIIAAWVRGHGGNAKALPKGSVYEDPDQAFVFVDNPRAQKLAAPGYWVLNTPDNHFFVLSDRDFEYLYEEIEEDHPEAPS